MGDIIDKVHSPFEESSKQSPEQSPEQSPKQNYEPDIEYSSADDTDISYSDTEGGDIFLKKPWFFGDPLLYGSLGIQGFLLSLLYLRDFADIDPVVAGVSFLGSIFLYNIVRKNFVKIYAILRRMTIKSFNDEEEKIKLLVTQWIPDTPPTDSDDSDNLEWSVNNIRENIIGLIYEESGKGVLNLRFSDSVTRKIIINA